MWFFKKTKAESDEATASDRIANKLAATGIKIQTLFSNKMNKLFLNTSSAKLKRLLIIFCIVSGGCSIYLFSTAIFTESNAGGFKVEAIKSPKHFSNTGDEKINKESEVDEKTFYQIVQFERYMDSLKQHKISVYDSILQARPGLMDSVQVLKQIYLSQKQK
ncbi:MAG: hypothetical protein ACN4EP_11320 [Sediminibacterium sp.]